MKLSADCLGGVVLACQRGTITIDNTVDSRMGLVLEQATPPPSSGGPWDPQRQLFRVALCRFHRFSADSEPEETSNAGLEGGREGRQTMPACARVLTIHSVMFERPFFL